MDDGTSILELKGIGEKSQQLFARVNIRTVGDLLHYYPRDYETFQEPVPIAQAKAGEVCAILATVCRRYAAHIFQYAFSEKCA